MNRTKTVIGYLFFDVLAAWMAWTLFFVCPNVDRNTGPADCLRTVDFPGNFYLALIILPLFWITIYYIGGYYNNIHRKARLMELGQTITTTFFGVLVLFFVFIADDRLLIDTNYFGQFGSLFGFHFGFTYLFRLIRTSRIIHRIHTRAIGFNAILIGDNEPAALYYREWQAQPRPTGMRIIGYVRTRETEDSAMSAIVPCLGTIDDIPILIESQQVEEVIVTVKSSEHELLSRILIKLNRFNVVVWGIPDLYDILSGNPKANNLYGRPLFKIANGIMPVWAANIKRIIDVVFSIVALLIFLPVSLSIALLIKLKSPGPVLYKQERIGRYGKPFSIYKFRTMIRQAEANGPELSGNNDRRITPIGRFLRKTHLDEIPQFYNVIIGQMSLVGPRPERRFYIDQLVERAPEYTLLHKVRPGITSWGQVKYGYASNLDQMLERLTYDLVYLKNASLYLDFKIMIYSILEIVNGKGK